MNLKRCTEEGQTSLEDYFGDYFRRASKPDRGKKVKVMLELLRALPFGFPVFGLTSHDCLHLLAEDDPGSDWLVTIEPDGSSFIVSYVLSEDQAPWLGARVSGRFDTPEKTVQAAGLALRESGGWDSR